MQIRRVLLLFALVLGLSALVASLAPPPEDEGEPPATTTARTTPPSVVRAQKPVSLGRGRARTRRVPAGSSFALEVTVREPGDVVLDELGLRQSADPLAPARFALLAHPPGRYEVGFVPVRGERRVIGQLVFRPRQRDH